MNICNWEKSQKYKPDKGVNFGNINVVQFLHCDLNLWLIGSEVNNEYQCIGVFDFLHGRLGSEWVLDNCKLVKFVNSWCRPSGVFWSSGETEGLGTMEVNGGSDLLLCF